MQAKSHLALVAPTGKKRAVAPGRRPNAAYRKREHLTETEIENAADERQYVAPKNDRSEAATNAKSFARPAIRVASAADARKA